MKRFFFPVIVVCLVLCVTISLARAENISYHGWTGQADVINGRFAGCYLDSPPPLEDFVDIVRERAVIPGVGKIRVVSDSTTQFFIQYVSHIFQDPQPPVGEVLTMSLGTMNGRDYRQVDYSQDYQARIIGHGVAENGKPFSRVLIRLNVDDPLVSHLKGALFLQVRWPTSDITQQAINMGFQEQSAENVREE